MVRADADADADYRRLRELDNLAPIEGLHVLEALDASTDWASPPRRIRSPRTTRPTRLPPTRRRVPGEGVRALVALSATCVAVALALHVSGDDASILHRLRGDRGAGVATSTGAGSFRFIAHQPGQPTTPVTYDPCRPIHVVYNPAGSPGLGEELVKGAVRTVEEDTGLDLVLDGRTTRRPASGRSLGRLTGAPRASDSPVLVSFATAEEVPALAGRVAGIGGSSWSEDAPGHLSYGTSEVTLDSVAFRGVIRGPRGPQLARAIVLHEFGHLVGLNHVHDGNELMHQENEGLLDFGPGDFEGLSKLGQAAAPEPPGPLRRLRPGGCEAGLVTRISRHQAVTRA